METGIGRAIEGQKVADPDESMMILSNLLNDGEMDTVDAEAGIIGMFFGSANGGCRLADDCWSLVPS